MIRPRLITMQYIEGRNAELLHADGPQFTISTPDGLTEDTVRYVFLQTDGTKEYGGDFPLAEELPRITTELPVQPMSPAAQAARVMLDTLSIVH
jgi:hypothetical protein